MSCQDSCVWRGRLLVVSGLALLALSSSAGAASLEDAVPPTPPKITLKSASATTLSFVWAGAHDNVGVSGYDVRLDEARPIPTTLPKADFKNLVCKQRYTVRVVSRDAAGNR